MAQPTKIDNKCTIQSVVNLLIPLAVYSWMAANVEFSFAHPNSLVAKTLSLQMIVSLIHTAV